MLLISDALKGNVMFTLRVREKRWRLMSWMSCFRSFFNFNDDDNNHHDDAQKEDIAVWMGQSTAGRPYLILSGALHDMTFDILTTTATCTTSATTNTGQQQRSRRSTRRRRRRRSVVGVVSKDLFDMHETLRETGRYGVHVQPGFDCALFVLLAIIVDELFHRPGPPAPKKPYERIAGSSEHGFRKGCGDEKEGALTHNGMETTTSESIASSEEEEEGGLPIALGLGQTVARSFSRGGESFSDIEDRMREKALMLEEHLTDNTSDS